MRLCLWIAAAGAVLAYVESGKVKEAGISGANNRFTGGVESGASVNGGAGNGKPIVYSSQKTKNGKKLTNAGGSRGQSVKAVNSGNARSDVKAFKTPDNKSMQGSANNKAKAAGGVISQGDEDTHQGRVDSPKGQGKLASTFNRATKNSKVRSQKVNADVKTESTTRELQKGIIELEGHRNSPFRYEVVCPPGNRPSRGECSEQVRGRDNQVYQCTVQGTTTNCRKNNGAGIGANTDKDGTTQINFKGLIFSKAECVGSNGKRNYNCKVSKGLLGSTVSNIEATEGPSCYRNANNPRSVKIQNVKYIADPGTGGDFQRNAHDCFTMKGDLVFGSGFSRQELRGIMSRIGIQFHGMINPVGKLSCHDKQVCPKLGKASQCYYCSFCEKGDIRKKLALIGGFDDGDFRKNCEMDASPKQEFSVRFCPPKDVYGSVCLDTDRSPSSGYNQKKGDVDSRIEVYLDPGTSTKTRAELAREFQGLGSFQRLGLRTKAGLSKLGRADDLDAFEQYVAERNRGELIGCATYTSGYGIGNSGRSVALDAAYSAYIASKGRTAELIRPAQDCPKLRAEKSALYGIDL